MGKIIKERSMIQHIKESWDFSYYDDPNSGFSFPVKNNEVVLSNEDAKRNYEWCLNNPDKVENHGIVKTTINCVKPAQYKCDCGEIIELTDQYMGACQCPNCGRWYNMFGQSLKSPDEW